MKYFISIYIYVDMDINIYRLYIVIIMRMTCCFDLYWPFVPNLSPWLLLQCELWPPRCSMWYIIGNVYWQLSLLDIRQLLIAFTFIEFVLIQKVNSQGHSKVIWCLFYKTQILVYQLCKITVCRYIVWKWYSRYVLIDHYGKWFRVDGICIMLVADNEYHVYNE